MVEGIAEGGGGGDLANGPLDGRTRVRIPDDDERHPWRIPLDRPCLLRYLTQNTFKPYMTAPMLESLSVMTTCWSLCFPWRRFHRLMWQIRPLP